MKIKKKMIMITAGGLAVVGAGAWFLTQNLRGTQIDVYPVSELSQSIWQSGAAWKAQLPPRSPRKYISRKNRSCLQFTYRKGRK